MKIVDLAALADKIPVPAKEAPVGDRLGWLTNDNASSERPRGGGNAPGAGYRKIPGISDCENAAFAGLFGNNLSVSQSTSASASDGEYDGVSGFMPISRSASLPSQEHSCIRGTLNPSISRRRGGNTRGRGRGGRPARPQNAPGCGNIDLQHREYKDEKNILFDGQDLDTARVLMGEYIRSTEKEKERLKRLEEQRNADDAPDDDDAALEGGVAADRDAKQNCRRMIVDDCYDYEDAASSAGDKALLDKHERCRLCRYLSMRTSNDASDFQNAYDSMVDLDYRAYGYMHDAQLFKEMCIIFNTMQRMVRDKGGFFFLITVEEVATHFREHNITNHLRELGELKLTVRNVIRKGRSYLFGKADQRDFWNSPKTKTFFSGVKILDSLIKGFTSARREMDYLMANGGANSFQRSKASSSQSRHLHGARVPGRFENNYTK